MQKQNEKKNIFFKQLKKKACLFKSLESFLELR